jgi:hypothetical protein
VNVDFRGILIAGRGPEWLATTGQAGHTALATSGLCTT